MTTVAVRERPILFSGPMVRAILEGRKTQTRRPVKFGRPGMISTDFSSTAFNVFRFDHEYKKTTVSETFPCPFGKPGDRLWVRETWFQSVTMKDVLGYAADVEFPKGFVYRKRPSIHMPRWASRINLEITNVRVERIRNISNEDCWAEGISDEKFDEAQHYQIGGSPVRGGSAECCAFFQLWDAVYANKGYGWEANPWVWVIEFKRMQP